MSSAKCPICQSGSEDGYCQHLLAILDLSFNDVQEGKAIEVFEKWISSKKEIDDAVFKRFRREIESVSDFKQSISDEDSGAGFSSSERYYWSKEPDAACERLRDKLGC